MADSSETGSDSDDSDSILSWLAQGFENIINAITSVYNTLLNLQTSIVNWFTDLFSNLGDWFGNIGTWFGELGTNIGNWFGSLGDNLGQWLSYLNPFDENFFGNKLIELLSQALSYLFTPSEYTITNLQESISAKFGFIDSIQIAIDDIKDMLDNIENGTSEFTVDIDSEYYSGEVILFNLSWYAPFKAYGDLVFTGFAYVLFVWRLWKSIPSILAGFSSVSDIVSRGGGD